MKIINVSYQRLDLKLSEPYTIAYETISKTTNFILKVETDSKIVGYGCSAPDVPVTSETPAQVEEAINDIIIPFLKRKNPYTYALLLAEIKALLGTKTSALAMVDMALHDLISKKADVPLFEFLGGYRNSIPTSVTIGILSLEDTVNRAKGYIDQGFFILKIKGGSNLEEDIVKMNKLQEMYPKITFRFDGNQGYTVTDSVAFYEATRSKGLGVQLLEQPTKIGEDSKMGLVTEQTEFPVMADESLKTLEDVFRLAKNEHIDMINIKLMKVGGILEGMHINSVAKSAGIQAMVGCIDECRLGIVAGLHFALARPNIQYADLDGHLDIIDDPFQNLFKLENGVLYPSDHAGLGEISM